MSLKTRAHCFVVRPQSPHLALQSCSEHSFHVVLCHSHYSCFSTQMHLTLHPPHKNTHPHHIIIIIIIMCAVHGNTRVLTGIGFLPPRSPSQPHKIFPSNAPPRRGPQFPNPRPCRHHCRFTRFRCWFNGGIGLAPSTKTLNWVVKIVTEMGLVEYAENLFGEMCARGVQSNCVSYRSWLLVIVKWVMFWRRIGGWVR